MFCGVCAFRVRVRESYRTSRSFGYGYESITELTEVPGAGTEVLQNSQKVQAGTKNAVPVPRVLWHRAYRTHRSYGYGYQSLTELPEVPGTVARAYRSYRSSGYGHGCRTELTEVLCTGVDAVQNRSSSG